MSQVPVPLFRPAKEYFVTFFDVKIVTMCTQVLFEVEGRLLKILGVQALQNQGLRKVVGVRSWRLCTGVPRVYPTATPYDPTVRLCLGSYGGARGDDGFL